MKDPTLFRFFNEIGIIEQLSRRQLARSLPDGLTVPQFGVLNHFVRRGGEQSPTRLAGAFQVTKGAMTNTLKRLEARGLVELRPDPEDGRAKRVRITAAGTRAREDCIAAIAPRLAELENRFSRDEFAAALPFLERVRATLDAARDGSLEE